MEAQEDIDEATIRARAWRIRAQKEAIAMRSGIHVDRVSADDLEYDWDWKPGPAVRSSVAAVPLDAIRGVLRRLGPDATARRVAEELGVARGRQLDKVRVAVSRLRHGVWAMEPGTRRV